MSMQIKTISMNLSAVAREQYPQDNLPHIAFAGRSNVGKSSCINTLLGRRKIAYVSQTPGKTRTVNFYNVNEEFYLVDLPGYGYAKLSRDDQAHWDKMMQSYFQENDKLLHIFLLIDIRHEAKALDLQMADFIRQYGYPFSLIATKTDKVSRSELYRAIQRLSKEFSINHKQIFPLSSLKKTGKEEILTELDHIFMNSGIQVSRKDNEYPAP